MALDQVAKEDCLEIFLMDFDAQVTFKVQRFRKTSTFPVLRKGLLDEQSSFGGEWPRALYLVGIQEFTEGEGKDLQASALPRICVAISFESIRDDEPVR